MSMSKYKDGRDDGKAANHGSSRSKSSVEPVLGSSKNHGHSDSSLKSHEANHQEKESRSSRSSTLNSESSSSRSHKVDDSKKSGNGNSTVQNSDISNAKRGNGKYGDSDKKRCTSPEFRRSVQDRDDSHKAGRGNFGRNSDTSRYDREKKHSHSRSPERRRDRKRSRSNSRERRRSRSKSRDRHRSRSREREKRRGHSRSRDRRSRSRDRRSRSRDRRSRSRDRRSRSRDQHSRSKDRRSRSRDKRSRSKDRRRSWSKDRRYRRSRSRERQRAHSRSRTPSYCRPRPAVQVTDKVIAKPDETKITEVEQKLVDMGHEKPSNLPLNDFSQLPKPGMMTPQMAVQQAMAAMNAKAQQLTGVTLPKYYNPAAVNPMKYAEQMQKRKLLWQSTQKKETTTQSMNNWEQTTFAQDQDGKMAAKFKKLMGIKSELEEKSALPTGDDQLRKQEELFRTLDQQYETARMSTHSFRGVGLGFTSAAASASLTSTHIVFPK